MLALLACQPDSDNNNFDTSGIDFSKPISVYLPKEQSEGSVDVLDFNKKDELADGSYAFNDISYDEFLIHLRANNASVKEIILDLADQFNIIVKSDVSYDRAIDIDTQHEVALEFVLRSLLDGHQYSVQYKDLSPSSTPQIQTILIGQLSTTSKQQYTPLRASVVSSDELASDFAIDFPFSQERVVIKTYSNDYGNTVYDNVNQLLSQSPIEETLDFINEIHLDGKGIRTLADIYNQSDNPEVKIEVLGSLTSSDSFAAKWVTLNALKDSNDEVVLRALEEISLWRDPASLAYVESLQNSQSPEIASLTQEIIEDVTHDASTESFINLTQEQRAAASKKAPEQLYSEQQRHKRTQEQLIERRKVIENR